MQKKTKKKKLKKAVRVQEGQKWHNKTNRKRNGDAFSLRKRVKSTPSQASVQIHRKEGQVLPHVGWRRAREHGQARDWWAQHVALTPTELPPLRNQVILSLFSGFFSHCFSLPSIPFATIMLHCSFLPPSLSLCVCSLLASFAAFLLSLNMCVCACCLSVLPACYSSNTAKSSNSHAPKSTNTL